MSDLNKIPVRHSKDVEQRNFEDFPSLPDLISHITKLLFINPEDVSESNGIVTGSSTPKAEDRGKIWINKKDGFMAFFSGTWIKIYKYPVNVPFVWISGDDAMNKITGLRKVTESEINKYGIPAFTDGKDGYWVIFNP